MTANDPAETAWYAAVAPEDVEGAAEAIREGESDEPRDWPRLAVDAGYADSETEYYDRLHEATMAATREAVRTRETADDKQLIHAVRAMDDCRSQANELAERLSEWASSLFAETGTGLDYAREVAAKTAEDATEARVVSLARRTVALEEEADELREYVETTTPEVAPNLSMLAGPVLAARLVALAGGLEALAKKPSGTVQVLGAEDALFAHLRGAATSPKHGVIYTHDAIRGTRPEDRGSAARALAGKLTIAARVDHYSGDRRPELQAELQDRIETIRARGESDE